MITPSPSTSKRFGAARWSVTRSFPPGTAATSWTSANAVGIVRRVAWLASDPSKRTIRFGSTAQRKSPSALHAPDRAWRERCPGFIVASVTVPTPGSVRRR